MSPLLSLRAPVSVNARLLAACGVTAVAAFVVALSAGGDAQPTAAVPACLAVGCVCAALVGHLTARLRAHGRRLAAALDVGGRHRRLRRAWSWTIFGQRSIFADGGPVDQGADNSAARFVIWHVALLAAGGLGLADVRARPRELFAFGAAGIALLAYASLSAAPFGDLVGDDGTYHAAMRTFVGVLAVAQLAVAAAWWRKAEGAPTWGEVCVIALMALSGLDALAYLFASEPYAGAWWASLTLRAGQFAVPAVGLVIGFIAVADRLRDLQDELGRGLEVERERARREEEVVNLDRRRREHEERRIARLIDGDGLNVALQPIVDLDSRRVVGAEALARFTDERGNRHADRGDLPRRPRAGHRRRARARDHRARAALRGAPARGPVPGAQRLPRPARHRRARGPDRARPSRRPAARGRAHRAPGGRGLRRAGRGARAAARAGRARRRRRRRLRLRLVPARDARQPGDPQARPLAGLRDRRGPGSPVARLGDRRRSRATSARSSSRRASSPRTSCRASWTSPSAAARASTSAGPVSAASSRACSNSPASAILPPR